MRLLHGSTSNGCILYEVLVGINKEKELSKQGYFNRPHAFYETNLGKKVLRKLSDKEKSDVLKKVKTLGG